jgi:hypothetical protein
VLRTQCAAIAIAVIAFITLGCITRQNDCAYMKAIALADCEDTSWEQARSTGTSELDLWRQRDRLSEACVASLPISERTIAIRDAPAGEKIASIVHSDSNEIPIELGSEHGNWSRIRISEGGSSGWVSNDRVRILHCLR